MRYLFLITLIFIISSGVCAQESLQQLLVAERGYAKAAAEIGQRQTALQFYSDDAIIFRPEAINAKEYWSRNGDTRLTTIRTIAGSDISSNGQLGYTTGSIELFPDGNGKPATEFGQFVTVWGRRENGQFRPILEMRTQYDRAIVYKPKSEPKRIIDTEANKSRRSSTDPAMSFLRMSMGKSALGGAYKEFGANDMIFLRDGMPPIVGRKNVTAETKDYIAVKFPFKVALIESGDMAYSWNPCEYANSEEGMERGNCLHIWKLRDKKWYIVLGAFSPVSSVKKPELKPGRKSRS